MRIQKLSKGSTLFFVSGLALGTAHTARAATFIVTNTNNTGAGSLRQAITSANTTAGDDIINFNIPGAGVRTISPASALPAITERIVIDGFTQPGSSPNTLFAGSNAVPLIEINGANAGAGAHGIIIGTSFCSVRGLIINRFASGAGVLFQAGNSSGVAGCFIGTNATGAAALPNRDGVLMTAGTNIVGGGGSLGTSVANRSVISGNSRHGVFITGAATSGNFVRAGLIGTNAAGTAALANATAGVAIVSSQSNTIGFQGPLGRNVISGNGVGVLVTASGASPNAAALNRVTGNYIGTDATGSVALGNATQGVRVVDASGNSIGEATNGANGRNIISGNNGAGVLLLETAPAVNMTGNSVVSNIIGLNAAATARLGNTTGISVQSPSNSIGNPGAAGGGNFIAGNGIGIELSGARAINNRITTNSIGTDLLGVNGATNLGNTADGIRITNASNNEIGVFVGNTITFNGGDGVAVVSGTGNRIERNSIFSNGGLGIDLVAAGDPANGVTPNDDNLPLDAPPLPDTDTGANDLQNFPVLTSASANATGTNVLGTLRSTGIRAFNLLFYTSPAADPSGNSEGRHFIGQAQVVTDANGVATFNVDLTTNAGGQVLTATATDSSTNNTSEFSNSVIVAGAALPTVVTNTNDTGPGSLRQAMLNSNAMPGTQTITFNIPGAGVKTINPGFPGLPQITDPVIINGYSQPGSSANTLAIGNNAVPLIEISGATTGDNTDGFVIREGGGGSTFRGLIVNRFTSGTAFEISTNSIVVEGCFTGTNAAGTTLARNGLGGISTSFGFASNGGNNRIGGPTPAQRNVIADSISLFSALPDVIQGNYIGTDKTGNVALGNPGPGISVGGLGTPVTSGFTIGGLTDRPGTGAGNVISGNSVGFGFGGIRIAPSGDTDLGPVTIQGNIIGLNAAGTSALGNGGAGIVNFQSNGISTRGLTTIGGTVAGARNIISGNTNFGLFDSTKNTLVQGNFIGTDITGTLDRGNGGDGIRAYGQFGFEGSGPGRNITIGGANGARNVISGNGGAGIQVNSSNATIQGNFIGTQVDGTSALGNGELGVEVDDTGSVGGETFNALVGGATPAQGNIIAFSPGDAITISGATTGAVRGNTIRDNGNRGLVVSGDSARLAVLGNSFFGNGTGAGGNNNLGIGIDLQSNGVTPNDPGDPDTGPNGLQNFPVLSSAASAAGSTTVQGTLNSLANTTFRIEFFANPTCDPSGNGEGQTFLGFVNVTTGPANGSPANVATINATLPVASSGVVTATATRLGAAGAFLETSEFSSCAAIGGAVLPTLSINDVAITEGNSGPKTFTFTVSLSAASGQAVSVNFVTANGTATAGVDYVARTTTPLTIPAGLLSGTIAVTVNGDATVEPSETFFVNLSTAVNATIADGTGIGTVINDDAPPAGAGTLQFSSATFSVNESGPVAIVTVTRTGGTVGAVSVQASTSNGTAAAGQDYTAVTNQLISFAAGDAASKTFTIPITNDALDENNETVNLTLNNPTGGAAVGAPGAAILTILDNDALPALAVGNVTLSEGNSGPRIFRFTVSLSTRSGRAVSVLASTANGTGNPATAGSDYVARSGITLTIPAGSLSAIFDVIVNGDTTVEPNETFFVNLSAPVNATLADAQGVGTITNDDALQLPRLSINDTSVVEGNSGTTSAVFTVTLSAAANQNVTVSFATANGTATAPADFTAIPATTLIFPAGITTRTITVGVRGDTLDELDETFFVNLSSPSGATLADGQGRGAIVDDDVPSGVVDVTPQVAIGSGTFRLLGAYYSGLYGSVSRYAQTITLTNVGNTTISGPVSLVLDNLSNATLDNLSGVTTAVAPIGSPFINLSIGSDNLLSPGETVSIDLQFSTSNFATITYQSRVLAGVGVR